jgi:hypothetical protein
MAQSDKVPLSDGNSWANCQAFNATVIAGAEIKHGRFTQHL